MLCETCQANLATVHIKVTKKAKSSIDSHETIEQFEHHFCPDCAAEFRRQERALCVSPGSRTEKVRVVSVLPDRTLLRVIGSASSEEWAVLTSRMPSQFPVGSEITMTFSEAELEWLKGNRDSI